MNEAFLVVPLLLAVYAYFSKALDLKGTISGLILAYVVLLSQNVVWLLLLLVFFIIGTLATKIKTDYKRRFGFFQKMRSTENVFSNGGVAALMALMNSPYGFLGALSAATADTLSSELGVLSRKKPRLITNLREVEPGTNGGVSLFGTLFAILGAELFGVLGLLFVPSIKTFVIITVAGFIGQFADSLIGASIEKRGTGAFKNWTTNFFATTFGALVALLIAPLL